MRTMKVGFTQLYLYQGKKKKKEPKTRWILISLAIKKHETMKKRTISLTIVRTTPEIGWEMPLLNHRNIWPLHFYGSLQCTLSQDRLNSRLKDIKSLSHNTVLKLLVHSCPLAFSVCAPPHVPNSWIFNKDWGQGMKSQGQFTHRADIHNSHNPKVTSKRIGHISSVFSHPFSSSKTGGEMQFEFFDRN